MKLLTLMLLPVNSVFFTAEQNAAREKQQSPRKQSETGSKLRKLIDEAVGWYQLYPSGTSKTPMQSRSVLRWTNNARGSEDGLTVIWIDRGRPEAVACIYPWEGYLCHGFNSLSRGRPLARRGDKTVWQPVEDVPTFRPIPDAPVPAESKAARLRQMKSLATRFQSTMLGWKSDDTDREPLRLLTRPLYRYQSEIPDLKDGALFAFVQGTDPESLLMIEAYRNTEAFQWQYAFVRRTSGALEGRHKGKLVWTARKFPVDNDSRKSYISLTHKIEP